jgi:hypothetical protein
VIPSRIENVRLWAYLNFIGMHPITELILLKETPRKKANRVPAVFNAFLLGVSK